jgi:hypothetical protein
MLMGMMMTDIERFDFLIDDFDDAYMIESDSGDYIKYEDYESLEGDYNVLRRDYQNLVDKLGELYKES